MRVSDDRYATEKAQFELALRMIRHEARTGTIRACTGLSDDRIRKLYGTYFRNAGGNRVKRRRGKSPRQVMRLVRNDRSQLQSTTLAALFIAGLLIRVDETGKVRPCWPRPDVDYGHRVCRAFESYRLLHPNAELSFEWAWNLLQTLVNGDELFLAHCRRCGAHYVQDAYALDMKACPACRIALKRARSGTSHAQ
jgi:hypothetical protein